MNRPYIICHMTMSADGKATGKFLCAPECAASISHYYEIHRAFHADAFACGRITMEESFTGGRRPDYSAFAGVFVPREDYLADPSARFYAVAFDRRGRLGWQASRISDEDPGYDNSHIIEVLCEDTPDTHLAYFRSIGVSYIFAGKSNLDLPLALEKLQRLFGIQTLLLEGGSSINGVFQRENVIDELSLVVAPLVADENDNPLFKNATLLPYRLTAAELPGDSTLWLRYQTP